jgi:hypothetical protein
MLDKSPNHPFVADTACGENPPALPHAIKSPKKRGPGRPDGSTVDPMLRIMRQTYNPERMIALLALTLIDERKAAGESITQAQAIDLAIAEFPRRFGGHQPRRVRMSVRSDGTGRRVLRLKGEPAILNRDKIVDLLDRCRITRVTLAEFRRWQPHVASLPYKIT